MIERQKAVVVYDLSTNRDIHTKSNAIFEPIRQPWGWAPYTRADVEETVEAWHELINAISDRLPQPYAEPLSNSPGLFTTDDLTAAGVAKDGFAWQFYCKARRPHFRCLAPGNLQLPSISQLIDSIAIFEAAWASYVSGHPYVIPEDKPDHPLPILLGHAHTEFWSSAYGSEMTSLPWGLHLDLQRSPGGECPYEDGSRLALLALRENTSLRRLDGRPAGHADLYQVGQNPFEPDHSTQLRFMLEILTTHVTNEEWRVDENGVSEPASAFEDVHAKIDSDSDEAENIRLETLYRMYFD